MDWATHLQTLLLCLVRLSVMQKRNLLWVTKAKMTSARKVQTTLRKAAKSQPHARRALEGEPRKSWSYNWPIHSVCCIQSCRATVAHQIKEMLSYAKMFLYRACTLLEIPHVGWPREPLGLPLPQPLVWHQVAAIKTHLTLLARRYL